MAGRVDVRVDRAYRAAVSAMWLRRVARKALEVAGAGSNVEMGLIVTHDDTLRRLNRDYRGLDEVTDVLSFSFTHSGPHEEEATPLAEPQEGTPFPLPPGSRPPLGEVAISYQQAERQAREKGHPVERELALLVTHGVLHLLGHDHQKAGDARAMQALESRVLAQLA